MYPMFIRNEKPGELFTEDEVREMLARDNKYLLPKHHFNRTRLVAWMVSNGWPKNSRKIFAKTLGKFVPVSAFFSIAKYYMQLK